MNCPNAYLTIPGLSGETETETEIVQEIDKLEQGLWTRRDQSTSNYYGSTSLADLRYISFVQCSLCLMLFPWSWQSVGMSKNRFPRFRDRTTGADSHVLEPVLNKEFPASSLNVMRVMEAITSRRYLAFLCEAAILLTIFCTCCEPEEP